MPGVAVADRVVVMTTTDVPLAEDARHDPTRKNVWLLSACTALSQSGNSIMIVTAPLVGYSLAIDKGLATLPLALQFTATMLATIPASLFMRHAGRRVGFSVGAVIGFIGAFLCAYGIFEASFWTFSAGTIFIGVYNAFVQFYRFAAADTARESYRSTAISLVLAGGIVAAIMGPELAKISQAWFSPVLFAGCYVVIMGLSVAVLGLMQFIEIPPLTAAQKQDKGRPLTVIASQPTFVVAVLSAAIGYAVMSLVMTSTPLAMVACGFAFGDSARVIQFHAIAMFAPSFFTGHLIRRFGAPTIIIVGAVLNFICLAVNLSGIEFTNFFVGLILLGLGWNFMFIGGTTLATETYTPSERNKTQAMNDFIVFSLVAAAAFSSGYLHSNFGWAAVNLGVAPPLAIALAAVVWLKFFRPDPGVPHQA